MPDHILHCQECDWLSDINIGMAPVCPECGDSLFVIDLPIKGRVKPEDLSLVARILVKGGKRRAPTLEDYNDEQS